MKTVYRISTLVWAAIVLGSLAVRPANAQEMGAIVAWGWNDHGQCNLPTPNTGFIGVAGGYYHSLGLKAHYGDLNCDGQVNFGDINPFVLLLTNPAGWQAMYPNCPMLNGDCNQDGVVDFGDINPFVRLLTNP